MGFQSWEKWHSFSFRIYQSSLLLCALRLTGSSVLGNKTPGPQKSQTLTSRSLRSPSQKLCHLCLWILSKVTACVISQRNHGHSPEKTMDSMDTHSDRRMEVWLALYLVKRFTNFMYIYIYIHIYDHNQIIVSYVSFSMHLIIYIYIYIFTYLYTYFYVNMNIYIYIYILWYPNWCHLGGFTTLTCLPHLWTEAIEVLLKAKAFVVKRVGGGSEEEDHSDVKGQYTWSKHGGVSNCWDVVRKAARWPNVAWSIHSSMVWYRGRSLYMICSIY